MADRTFAWLDEQLRRPVELVTWRTWRGRTLRRWRLADTGQFIAGDLAGWRLEGRKVPVAVQRLR
jgi:hypothetical protein